MPPDTLEDFTDSPVVGEEESSGRFHVAVAATLVMLVKATVVVSGKRRKG